MNRGWVEKYTQRICYAGALHNSSDCLKALHQAHLMSVPFEDLDIHLGRPLSLNLQDLYHKVVQSGRGGFCYELNHLFGSMLRELGFQVNFIAAQVYGDDEQWGPQFDHMAIQVNGTWLVDVGFGGRSFVHPLLLNDHNYQIDPGGVYQIKATRNQKFHLLKQDREESAFKPMYQFDLEPQDIRNFQTECSLKQRDPNSHFVKNKICTVATSQGRDSLLNSTFTRSIGSQKEINEIHDREMEADILKKYFKIII